MEEINIKLLKLVSDENFVKIDFLSKRPNLFKIVGRTHTETWHSMFLGWLLDPLGSHGLCTYPLQRLLVAVSNPIILDNTADLNRIAKIASMGNFSNVEIWPNEKNQEEYRCEKNARFDIFIKFDIEDSNEKVMILLEQKVDDTIKKQQCFKYLNWLKKQTGYFTIPIFLAPSDMYGISSLETFGDSSWYGIDYQLLHDTVLLPIVSHPSLNPQAKILIEQYIDVLRIPNKGRKLAVTEEEKDLALQLLDKHKEAFEAIQEALSDTTDISLVPVTAKSRELKLLVNDSLIQGNTVPAFYKAALKFMVENIKNVDQHLPYATSNKRYLIAKNKKHPNGTEFRVPVQYKGYYMEAHKSYEQAIKALAKFFKLFNFNIRLAE